LIEDARLQFVFVLAINKRRRSPLLTVDDRPDPTRCPMRTTAIAGSRCILRLQHIGASARAVGLDRIGHLVLRGAEYTVGSPGSPLIKDTRRPWRSRRWDRQRSAGRSPIYSRFRRMRHNLVGTSGSQRTTGRPRGCAANQSVRGFYARSTKADRIKLLPGRCRDTSRDCDPHMHSLPRNAVR